MITIPNNKLLVTGGKLKSGVSVQLRLKVEDGQIRVGIKIDRADAPDDEEALLFEVAAIGSGGIRVKLDFHQDVFSLRPRDLNLEECIDQNLLDYLAEIAFMRCLQMVRFNVRKSPLDAQIDCVYVKLAEPNLKMIFHLADTSAAGEKSVRYVEAHK